MTSSPWVRVDGEVLSHLVNGWGDLTVTHRRRGPWEMSFGIDVAGNTRPPELSLGVPVEVMLGSSPIWAGELAEPDWDAGSMTAVGACRTGEEVICLDGSGATTSTPDVAIDEAIARGVLNWARPSSLSSAPLVESDETSSLNYLTALLDAWEADAGKTWSVSARRFVTAITPPTVPTFQILPGAQAPALSNEILAGTIFGRYQGLDGRWATASVGSGKPEIGISLAQRGRLSAAQAGTIVSSLLAKLGAQSSWSSGIEVTAGQIVSDGTPVDLAKVLPNQMADSLGQDARFVVDETVWNVSEGLLQIKPVGMVARDLRSIVGEAGGEVL